MTTITPDDARTRQDIIHSLHEALRGAVTGLKTIPAFVREALTERVWEKDRVFAGGSRQGPLSFHDFVHKTYPVGLGSTYDDVQRFLGDDGEALRLWDEASGRQGERTNGNSAQAAVASELEDDPDPLHGPEWREATREYHANRPALPSHAESAARWAQAERAADRTLRGEQPEWSDPPESTIQAALFVIRTGDTQRLKRFLAGRPLAEIDAITRAIGGKP
jgi:hypothetical protein